MFFLGVKKLWSTPLGEIEIDFAFSKEKESRS